MSLALFLFGLLLILRPLPALLLPEVRHSPAFVDVLENFVDQARAGLPTTLALQSALAVDTLLTIEIYDHISAKYFGDPIAQQFALMWQQLARRGAGVVEGAAVLSEIARNRIAQDEELAAKTSGARATFRLLLLLPVWFLVIGQLVGLPALSVLLHHFWGYLLIAVAALLMWLGHGWMQRILVSV